jgi:exopolysaccharide biosynthesis polyprenyl glycosylphosphotransferase
MRASLELSKQIPSLERRLAFARSDRVKASASQFLTRSYKIADVLIAILCVPTAFIITNSGAMPEDATGFFALRVSVKNLLLITIFALQWSAICHAFGLYRKQRRNPDAIMRAAAASVCGGLFILLFMMTSRAGLFGLYAVLFAWSLAIFSTVAVRPLFNALSAPTTPSNHPRQVLIVGSGARALKLYRQLNGKAGSDYQVIGFVDSNGSNGHSTEIQSKLLGNLAQLEEILVGNIVDEVLITLPVKSCYAQIETAIQICERIGVESKYLSEIFEPSLAKTGYERMEGIAVTSRKPVSHDSRFVVKRAIDIAGALLGLIVLSPLFVLIAVAIRLTSGMPIFFSQERYGRNKRRFKMHKFRTMVPNAEALQRDLEHRNEVGGPVFKIKDDPRMTRIGRFLRRTSLDELPQLLNVLKGEMSLVGPRPLPLRDVSRFEEGWLMRRFCVAPGLTGLWQVNGRSHTSFEQWVAHDLKYIDTWSLTLDLKILLKTVPAVLRGVGAL